MELNHRLSLCRRIMTGARRHERERSCAELVAASLLELLSDTQDEGALHNGHVLVRWVPMRRNAVSVRQFDSKREWAGLRRVALEGGSLAVQRAAAPVTVARADKAVRVRVMKLLLGFKNSQPLVAV